MSRPESLQRTDSSLLLHRIRLYKKMEELQRVQKDRRWARQQHEERMEELFRRKLFAERRVMDLRRKRTPLRTYLQALEDCCESTHDGILLSPYLLRKQAVLCQVFHETEVGVKQLHLAKDQHLVLTEWMSKEADKIYDDSKRTEKDLLQRLHSLSAQIEEMERMYKATITMQQLDLASRIASSSFEGDAGGSWQPQTPAQTVRGKLKTSKNNKDSSLMSSAPPTPPTTKSSVSSSPGIFHRVEDLLTHAVSITSPGKTSSTLGGVDLRLEEFRQSHPNGTFQIPFVPELGFASSSEETEESPVPSTLTEHRKVVRPHEKTSRTAESFNHRGLTCLLREGAKGAIHHDLSHLGDDDGDDHAFDGARNSQVVQF